MSADEDRKRTTAYHEAGHAVSDYVFGVPVHTVSIIPARTGGSVGHVLRIMTQEGLDASGDLSTERVWAEVVGRFAGISAEEKATGEYYQFDVYEDYRIAATLAAHEVGRGRALDTYLKRAYERAIIILQQKWPVVEAVAEALLDHKELSGAAVREIIEQADEGHCDQEAHGGQGAREEFDEILSGLEDAGPREGPWQLSHDRHLVLTLTAMRAAQDFFTWFIGDDFVGFRTIAWRHDALREVVKTVAAWYKETITLIEYFKADEVDGVRTEQEVRVHTRAEDQVTDDGLPVEGPLMEVAIGMYTLDPYQAVRVGEGRKPKMRDQPSDRQETERKGFYDIWAAVRTGHVAEVERLLADGTDVNARAELGLTPLHLAATGGHTEIAGLLLAHGASSRAQDDGFKTPLDWALMKGHTEVVDLLREHMANDQD